MTIIAAKSRRLLGLKVSALLFVGSSVLAAGSGDANLDRAIAKANSEWAIAMKIGDAAMIAAPYTDDAVFIGFDGSCAKGRPEIERLYRARFASGGLAVSTKIEPRRIDVDGDLAYESGSGEIETARGGKPAVNRGRYLTVWRRQSDGDWKILRNVVLP